MRRTKHIIYIIFIIILVSACNLIRNTFKYKDITKEFIETLLKEDYNKCVGLMAMDHEMAKHSNIDTMKKGFAEFRQLIITNWGKELEFSFVKSEKRYSTLEADNTPDNTTLVLIEFNNQKDLGIFQVLFDDKSNKILNIQPLDVKEPIPNMTLFWLFGLIAICIPVFNIYIIRQIKRSTLTKKWRKYLAVIFMNVPAITYKAVYGLSILLLNFQFLFGISFSRMGFLSSYWTFGIPLGGLYWFWKLRQKKDEGTEPEMPIVQNTGSQETIETNNSQID